MPVALDFPLQREEVVVIFVADRLPLAKEHRVGTLPDLGCDLLHRVSIQVLGKLPPVDLQVVLKGVFREPILLTLGVKDHLVVLAELVAFLPVLLADSLNLRVPEVFVEPAIGLFDHALVSLEAEVAAVV